MRVICAECERPIGEVGGPGGGVSHGLCLDCAEEVYRELGLLSPREQAIQEFTEGVRQMHSGMQAGRDGLD